MVKDLEKVEREDNYDLNFELQMMQIRKREREIWRNNRFCDCGADNIYECECEAEKQRRFRKRRKRKINEEFDRELRNLMAGRLPHNDSRDNTNSRGA